MIHAGAVSVVVESDLVETLEGASIDYSEDDANLGFTIDAPNAPPPS